MRKRGSSKEPRKTGYPQPEGRKSRRSGRRRRERKARKMAGRRTGVDSGKAAPTKTADTAKSSRRSRVDTDRLV